MGSERVLDINYAKLTNICAMYKCTPQKRAMGLEPTTFTLGRWHSTTELHPHLALRLAHKAIDNLQFWADVLVINYNWGELLHWCSLRHQAKCLPLSNGRCQTAKISIVITRSQNQLIVMNQLDRISLAQPLKIRIVAHRGKTATVKSENTIEAFQKAIFILRDCASEFVIPPDFSR